MKHFSVLMVMALVAFVACNREPEVSIDKTSVDLSYKGGTCDLTVSANCEWEIICNSDNKDLISISQVRGASGEQTIRINVNENESTSILKHYITAVAHGDKRDALTSMTITQGAPAYVQFSKSIFTADYIGGEFKFTVASNFPWSISVQGEGISVSPLSGTPKAVVEDDSMPNEKKDDEEEDEGNVITVTIDEYEGDVNRQFVLYVTAIGDDAVVNDKLTITQTRPLLMIGNREYPIKKMGDGRWWMVQNLCYSSKSSTIGDPISGIWYPCSDSALEFDSSREGIISKGLLYSDATAFNETITATTAKKLEGAQGLCPAGWHIPTLKELLALVGKSRNSQIEVNTAAPYYDAARDCGSLSMLEEAGFNTTTAGYVKGKGKGFAENGDIQGYIASRGYITNTYIFCSTAYDGTRWYTLCFNKVANTANIEYMSNFTTANPFAGSVRCIKNE